jgi:hypothetical protein
MNRRAFASPGKTVPSPLDKQERSLDCLVFPMLLLKGARLPQLALTPTELGPFSSRQFDEFRAGRRGGVQLISCLEGPPPITRPRFRLFVYRFLPHVLLASACHSIAISAHATFIAESVASLANLSQANAFRRYF